MSYPFIKLPEHALGRAPQLQGDDALVSGPPGWHGAPARGSIPLGVNGNLYPGRAAWFLLRVLCLLTAWYPFHPRLQAGAPNYSAWTGNTSGEWSTAGNWSPSVVPGINSNVVINLNAGNQPVISTAAGTAKWLWMGTSGSLLLGVIATLIPLAIGLRAFRRIEF